MKPSTRRRRANQHGFTLIEVMVSLGVMTVGAMAMISLQQHTIRSNSHARQLAIATHIAQQWIERLKQDAHTWNVAGDNDATVQAAMNRTRYLGVVTTEARDRFQSPEWFETEPFVSNVYDYRGLPLPHEGGFADRVFFCTSYRTNWVYFGRALRADVRVWWPREHTAGDTSAIPNWCEDGDGTVDPDDHHIVQLSTVVRMNPVIR